MLPMRFFRSAAFSSGNAASFLLFGSIFGAAFFFAQFLQTTLHYGPLGAGLRLAPWTVTLFVVAPIAGALVNRVGERPFIVGGMLLQAAGFAWIALIARPGLPYPAMMPPLVLAGSGVSMAMPAAQNSVIGSVPRAAIGKASGAFNTLRQLGGTFGIAILAAVFAGSGGYASAQAFSNGFAPAIGVAAGLSLVAAVAGLWTPGRHVVGAAAGRLRAPRGEPMSASDQFARQTDPFRRELLAHCYRMLGSVHDAEDLVQETFLRAWRSYGQFDDRRASLRTWLYRIATNACLTALEQRGRRALPSELVDPSAEPLAPIVASRGSIRLALIAALQHLPARQRAVLILRDVLAWRATEVADLLDTSTAAVNRALQRARAQLAEATPAEDQIAEPSDADQRELLDRYVTAFVNADTTALARLLRDDVELEMPPFLLWFSGRHDVAAFIANKATLTPDRWRMIPTSANGQPAVGAYLRRDDGAHRAHSVQVFTFADSGVARIVAFLDPDLFATFGLPLTYSPAAAAPRR